MIWMLRLKFGHIKGEHYSGNGYFDHWVDTECILSDFGRRVIKAIDKGEVLSKMCITSPVWDTIPPMLLSGGTKTLLTIANTNEVFRIHAMGDNCFPFLKEICDEKDVTVTASKVPALFKYGFSELIVFTDTDEFRITNAEQLFDLYINLTTNENGERVVW